ncbi:fatty acid desaturase [Glaciihabitans sp. GrIS 2.15]|nr:fatty acid desaturase [Glaciihabitans sp. GrIS 2.15]
MRDRQLGKASRGRRRALVLGIVSGTVLIALGISFLVRGSQFGWMIVALGAVNVILTFVIWHRARPPGLT